MRREDRVTVQGPVKEQPDGMSHGGGGGRIAGLRPRRSGVGGEGAQSFLTPDSTWEDGDNCPNRMQSQPFCFSRWDQPRGGFPPQRANMYVHPGAQTGTLLQP